MFQQNIFSGSSSALSEHGRIEIDGKGSSATITLTDNDGNITNGTLTIKRNDTLPSSIKNSSSHKQIELFNTWDVYDSTDAVMIFCDTADQAIHCTKGPSFDFDKVWHPMLEQIEFFKEIGFEKILAEVGCTFAQLRRMRGMTEDKLKILMDNRSKIKSILSAGFKLEQIANLAPGKIENLFASADKLKNALKLVSHEQILGVGHSSPQLPNTQIRAEANRIVLPMPGHLFFANEFKFEHAHSSLVITCAPSPGFRRESDVELKATITRQNLDDDLISRLKAKAGDLPAEKLANDWYVFHDHENLREVFQYFSSSFNELIIVKADANFPQDVLWRFGQLNQFQYFKEKAVFSLIADNNFLPDVAQKLFALPDSKIKLLCSKVFEVGVLAKKGVTIEQLLSTDEKRLNYILNCFGDAEAALAFVDSSELLGLRDPRPVLNAFSSTRNQMEQEGNNAFSLLKSCVLQ